MAAVSMRLLYSVVPDPARRVPCRNPTALFQRSAKPRRATKEGQCVLRTPLHVRSLFFSAQHVSKNPGFVFPPMPFSRLGVAQKSLPSPPRGWASASPRPRCPRSHDRGVFPSGRPRWPAATHAVREHIMSDDEGLRRLLHCSRMFQTQRPRVVMQLVLCPPALAHGDL